MSEHKIPIPSMIYNAAVGGHVTNSQQIIDENLNREQNDINQETVGTIPYNSTTPNGMGRIVLKKNDNFKQVIETQTSGNTIFIIKYDFILTDNVTIPVNCVLEFDGGSISGGYTITGNKTGIKACLVKIFNTNVTLSGSWNVSVAYPEWFGAKGDGVTDDRLAIQVCLNSFITTKLINTYLLDSFTDTDNKICIIVNNYKNILGNKRNDPSVANNIQILTGDNISSTAKVIIEAKSNVKIEDVTLQGTSVAESLGQIGIRVDTYGYISNCYIYRTCYGVWTKGFEILLIKVNTKKTTYGIYCKGLQTSITLINCYVGDSYKEAYFLDDIQYSNLISCAADGCGVADTSVSGTVTYADSYPVYRLKNCQAVSVRGCGAEQCVKILQMNSCINCTIENIFIEGRNTRIEENFDYSHTIAILYGANNKLSNFRIGGFNFPSSGYLMYSENADRKIYFEIDESLSAFYDRLSMAGWTYNQHKSCILKIPTIIYGESTRRPTTPSLGQSYFDTSLSPERPIYWNGTAWVDATGTQV